MRALCSINKVQRTVCTFIMKYVFNGVFGSD